MIVMVSSLGDIWVTPKEAVAIASAMKNNVSSISLRGSIYTTKCIQGLLKPDVYKTMCYTKKRNWMCKQNTSHSWKDVCKCTSKDIFNENRMAINSTNILTPEQQDEETRKRFASVAWIAKYKNDMTNPDFKNKAKRQEFIKNYKLSTDLNS